MKADTGQRTRAATAPERAAAVLHPALPAPPRTARTRAAPAERLGETCRRLAARADRGRRGDALWREFVDAALPAAGAVRGALYLLAASGDYVPQCTRGLTPHQERLVAKHRVPRGGTVLLARLESTLHPLVAHAAERVFAPMTRAFGVRTLLLVPVVRGGACAGFFACDGGDRVVEVPPAIAEVLADGAARLATAIEAAELRHRHAEAAHVVALEHALAAAFAGSDTVDVLATAVGDALASFLDLTTVEVEWFDHGADVRRRAGWSCRCGAGAMPRLCVPFPHDGAPAGALHLHGVTSRRRLDPAIRRAQDAAARATAVAHRLRQIAELERLATRDPLTGLTNRREFVHRLDGELARARREGVPLTVMYLDLDDLKGLNDSVGHPAADAALCELAERIVGRVRASDIVARVGGDEFALLLPHTAARGGLVLFTTLLESLREIVVEGRAGGVSVSGGLATYPDHGRDAASLLRAADAALYAAKRRGKGGACIAEDVTTPR